MSSLSQVSQVCLRHCWISMVKWCLVVCTVSMVWFQGLSSMDSREFHGLAALAEPTWLPFGCFPWASLLWYLAEECQLELGSFLSWLNQMSQTALGQTIDFQSTKSSCLLMRFPASLSLKRQPCREGSRWNKTSFFPNFSHPIPSQTWESRDDSHDAEHFQAKSFGARYEPVAPKRTAESFHCTTSADHRRCLGRAAPEVQTSSAWMVKWLMDGSIVNTPVSQW